MKFLTVVPAANEAQVSVLAERTALAGILIVALFLRFYQISEPTIWYDEAYSLLLARETPSRIWALTAMDVHPPLYYVLLHYWCMLWGESTRSARALSVLADIGTLLLCMKLMSLIARRRTMWIAALLLALLPISVRYSQEARMYALLGFWLMGATVALVCWAKAPERKGFAVIYVLLMTAAFYTQYFAGFCILVHWLFWGQVYRSARSFIAVHHWLGANIGIVLLFVPWIPHLYLQLHGGQNFWIEPATAWAVPDVVRQFTFMGSSEPVFSFWRPLPLLLLVICAGQVFSQYSRERHFGGLLVSYFFVPAISLYLLAMFTAVFVPRYLTFAAPGIAMVAAVALDSWGQRHVLSAAAFAVLLIAGQLHGLAVVYRQADGLNGTQMRRDYHLRSVINEIKCRLLPGDRIVLDSLISYLPFSYYSDLGIQPRFYVRSSMSEFLPNVVRGGYALIPESMRWIYFHDWSVVQAESHRVWWVMEFSNTFSTPLPHTWEPVLTVRRGSAVAYLFRLRPASASSEADMLATVRPPPPPSAQNCPPAPSATSVNRTRHSLPR